MDARWVAAAMAALSVITIIYGVYKWRQERALSERLDKLIGREATMPSLRELELQRPFKERVLRSLVDTGVTVIARFIPPHSLTRLDEKLIQAGRPGGLSALEFTALRWLLALIGGGAAAVVALSSGLPVGKGLYAGLLVGFLAYVYPHVWLNSRVRARQKEILKALPDALDLLTVAVDAGLGFDAALMKVAYRWDNALTQEFRRVLDELHMGVPRAEALRRMAQRTGVPELASFVAILIQSERLGASITRVLHAQADAMRTRRRQRAEEEAHKAPVKMMIPLVLFVFPALFIVIVGPALPLIMAAFGK